MSRDRTTALQPRQQRETQSPKTKQNKTKKKDKLQAISLFPKENLIEI